MITLLTITTIILVGVSVKLYLDKQDLNELSYGLGDRIDILNRSLDIKKAEFKTLEFCYEVYKHESEKAHQELNGIVKSLNKKDQDQNDKIIALKLINESLTNTYYKNSRQFDELYMRIETLEAKLKKERNKAKQIKYDKQNDTIVDPEFLTELGDL